MEKKKILEILAAVDYTLYGGQYAVIHNEDLGDVLYDLPTERVSQNDPNFTLVSLDREFSDEEDLCEALSYCGLYTGQ